MRAGKRTVMACACVALLLSLCWFLSWREDQAPAFIVSRDESQRSSPSPSPSMPVSDLGIAVRTPANRAVSFRIASGTAPIGGAEVRFVSGSPQRENLTALMPMIGISDQKGCVAAASESLGDARYFAVFATGHVPAWVSRQLPAPEVYEVSLSQAQEVSFAVRQADGSPVANVEISLSQGVHSPSSALAFSEASAAAERDSIPGPPYTAPIHRAITRTDGSFTISNMVPGRYMFKVASPDWILVSTADTSIDCPGHYEIIVEPVKAVVVSATSKILGIGWAEDRKTSRSRSGQGVHLAWNLRCSMAGLSYAGQDWRRRVGSRRAPRSSVVRAQWLD